MANQDNDTPGVWRDEERLPLEELTKAVATSADDGQKDDLTGNDAGTGESRNLRPDFNGPTGPN